MHERDQYRIRRDSRSAHAGPSLLAWNGILHVSFARRFPSINGFRVRGSFHLRRGQIVEVILDEDPLNAVRCSVVWIGKTGSRNEGEVGGNRLVRRGVHRAITLRCQNARMPDGLCTSTARGNSSLCRGFSQREHRLKGNATNWKRCSPTNGSLLAWGLLRNSSLLFNP